MAGLLQFPCRYHPMGCREAFPLTKKEAHERDCPFLQLKCPFHGQVMKEAQNYLIEI